MMGDLNKINAVDIRLEEECRSGLVVKKMEQYIHFLIAVKRLMCYNSL